MKRYILASIAAGAAILGAGATGTADIQGVNFIVDTIAHYYIGPGVTHSHLQFTGNGRTFHAYVMDMDRTASPRLRAKVDIGNDSCLNAERMTAIAKRKTTADRQYLAGINGDFFITSPFAAQHPLGNSILGYPNMSCVTDGKIAAPDMIDRVSRENAIIVDRQGYMYIDATDLRYRLLGADASTPILDVTAVNYPRLDGDIMVYNSFNGKYTRTPANGRELTLLPAPGEKWDMNRPMKFVVDGSWRNGGNSPIPADGIVISVGPGYSNPGLATLEALSDGDAICLEIECSLPAFGGIRPDISEVCGGDVRILCENKVTTEAIRWINTPSALYSRSFAGYSRDRNHLVMCAVDGSVAYSSGVSYYEGADLMRYLGCWDALDLDGGGSTAIWEHKNGIVNVLRDGSERAVGNGLYFVLDAPADDKIASLRFSVPSITLPQYGIFKPTIYGYNQYGQLIDSDVQGFTLSAPQELGQILENGTALMTSGSGCHALTVTKDGMTATIPVSVDNSAASTPRLQAVLLDNVTPWTIELQCLVGGKMLSVSPLAYSWHSDNEAVATVDENGTVTGLADGNALITGTLGGSSISISVTVECPKAPKVPALSAEDSDGWTIAGIGVKKNSGSVTPATDGIMDFAFTISSVRGHSLQISKDIRFYSRPDALELTLDPHGTALKEVGFDIQPGDSRSVRRNIPATAIADGCYSASLSLGEVAPKSAIDSYPMTLKSVFITPASAKTGTYTYTIKGMDIVYNNYMDGIENVTVDNTDTSLPVVRDGNTLSIPYSADSIVICDLSGRIVASRSNAASISVPAAHGMYIMRATVGGKTRTAKIMM